MYVLLQKIQRTLHRIYAPSDENTVEEAHEWEYNLLKTFDHFDPTFGIDFLGFTLEKGLSQYCEHELGGLLQEGPNITGSHLRTDYKNYLLLCCASAKGESQKLVPTFLAGGADPNATFFLPVHSAFKITPWLRFLITGGQLLEGQRNAIQGFLARDASLDDRIVLQIFISTMGGFMVSWPWVRQMMICSKILVEVNAAFLPREYVASAEGEESLLQHPNLLEVPSHRQVLLVQESDESRWAIATSQTSASLLTSLYGLNPKCWRYCSLWFLMEGAEQICGMIQELCHNELEKVNHLDFLEQRGYYKRPEDPAVPQRPFARFENITEMEESSEGKEACNMPSLKDEC
ncbi:hypothetical protein GJ744_001932 [Endocarpon pusillum]|uniref:Uncharacterized protein n=1 Tax=Endocarpon pusillum TaxID=364733 RepID=A0A8H7E6L8_9EURO|nr:hypothetical protein GJ744_001932 [Endocarpon pusillum]